MRWISSQANGLFSECQICFTVSTIITSRVSRTIIWLYYSFKCNWAAKDHPYRCSRSFCRYIFGMFFSIDDYIYIYTIEYRNIIHVSAHALFIFNLCGLCEYHIDKKYILTIDNDSNHILNTLFPPPKRIPTMYRHFEQCKNITI